MLVTLPMPNRFSLVRATVVAALTVTTACASAPKTAGAGNPNLLTIEEVESRGVAAGSLYDAIQKLRPSYLRFHGMSGTSTTAGTVQVSLDGGMLMAAETLRNVPARQLYELRFLSATDAAQRFGTSANSGPVILVRQK